VKICQWQNNVAMLPLRECRVFCQWGIFGVPVLIAVMHRIATREENLSCEHAAPVLEWLCWRLCRIEIFPFSHNNMDFTTMKNWFDFGGNDDNRPYRIFFAVSCILMLSILLLYFCTPAENSVEQTSGTTEVERLKKENADLEQLEEIYCRTTYHSALIIALSSSIRVPPAITVMLKENIFLRSRTQEVLKMKYAELGINRQVKYNLLSQYFDKSKWKEQAKDIILPLLQPQKRQTPTAVSSEDYYNSLVNSIGEASSGLSLFEHLMNSDHHIESIIEQSIEQE